MPRPDTPEGWEVGEASRTKNKINKTARRNAMTAGERMGSPASASITAKGANSRAAGAAVDTPARGRVGYTRLKCSSLQCRGRSIHLPM